MEETLRKIEKEVKRYLDRKDKIREESLKTCREIVRLASEVIKDVHRYRWQEANRRLQGVTRLLKKTQQALETEPDLRYAGFVTMAEKEYAEAAITLAVLGEKRLPPPEELGVPAPEYLNGMAEAIGELRRHLLDRLRKEELAEAERILSVMDNFYYFLFSLDYPDAILRGLRRMVDNDRAILERTRADLTNALLQENLRQQMLRVEKRMKKR